MLVQVIQYKAVPKTSPFSRAHTHTPIHFTACECTTLECVRWTAQLRQFITALMRQKIPYLLCQHEPPYDFRKTLMTHYKLSSPRHHSLFPYERPKLYHKLPIYDDDFQPLSPIRIFLPQCSMLFWSLPSGYSPRISSLDSSL
jgi:hypothetical protein